MHQEIMFPASHCWSRNTDPLFFLLYTCVILVSTTVQFSFTLEHHHNLSPKFGILIFFAFVMKLNRLWFSFTQKAFLIFNFLVGQQCEEKGSVWTELVYFISPCPRGPSSALNGSFSNSCSGIRISAQQQVIAVSIYGTFCLPFLFLSFIIYTALSNAVHHAEHPIFTPKLVSSSQMHDRNWKTGN